MEDRPEGLQKVAATDDAQQLPPGTTTGMAIGTEIAPAHPAAIGTVGGQDLRDLVDHALRQGQGAVADLDGQQLALRVHRDPDPLGHTLQALDGLGLADLPVFDCAEQGTVLGSTSKTRAVPRIPSPSARHAMTRTMRSTEARLP